MDNYDLVCLAPIDGKKLGITMPAEVRHRPLTILDLPKYIRDMIWEFVVVHPNIYVAGIAGYGRPTRSDHPDLSIFLVCRQIYEEAMRVYYSKNNFVFWLEEDIHGVSQICRAQAFLQDRPAPALQYINSIEMDMIDYTPGSIFFLETYTNFVSFITTHVRLQHLTLTIHVMHLSKVFEDFGCWTHMVELCKIPKVPRLTIKLDIRPKQCESHIESTCFNADTMCGIAAGVVRGVEIMKILRSEMLKNEASLGTKSIRTTMMSTPDSCPDQPWITVLLFEVDNNSEGECLLPTLLDAGSLGYTNTCDVLFSGLGPEVLDILNKSNEQQYAELQQAAYKFGQQEAYRRSQMLYSQNDDNLPEDDDDNLPDYGDDDSSEDQGQDGVEDEVLSETDDYARIEFYDRVQEEFDSRGYEEFEDEEDSQPGDAQESDTSAGLDSAMAQLRC
ncbi:hypothetical protein VSDG_05249 [Cytospora chrysosperma]|uniref:Uncharacterized protein n=1 Tax=Cytospora chrysosperma TaxID=252740 RepID=A0A423VXQ9_CYTCH|nr:hypothetical protein VSDG_05249 [Valsa sordida]